MVKKLVLLLLLAVPLATFAQDKIAFIDLEDIFANMPEVTELNDIMRKEYEAKQKTLQELDNELAKFAEEAEKVKNTLSEEDLAAKYQEFQKKQLAIETFRENGLRELQEKNEQLMAPIRQKVQQAIKEAGDENNLTYIMEAP